MLHVSRTLYAAAGIACFVGALALTPDEVRGTLGVGRHTALPQPAIRPPIARIAPERDPFVPSTVDEPPTPAPVSHPPSAAPVPFGLAGIGPLPPNAGASAMGLPPFANVARPRVLAVVTGPQPSALIDAGGTTRLFFLGDVLDGSVLRSIESDGVSFTDGRRLTIVNGSEIRP